MLRFRYNGRNASKFLNKNVKSFPDNNVTPSNDKFVIMFQVRAVKMLLNKIVNR